MAVCHVACKPALGNRAGTDWDLHPRLLG
jgi:hypothetical protein